MFGNPDFFFQTSNCSGAVECVNPTFAWNHGDIQDEIGNTWVGMVGPGVANRGVDATTWTDHTNVRPTVLALLGLHDDYVADGRVLAEGLTAGGTPQALLAHRDAVLQLGAAYEQLNAPFGSLAMDTLQASTRALKSTDEATYGSIEGSIATLTSQRDVLAAQIRSALNAAAFSGQPLDQRPAQAWIGQADGLIRQAHALASPSS